MIMNGRIVCKALKEKLEQLPEIYIALSYDGSRNVTRNFLLSFKGEMTLWSRTYRDPYRSWFKVMVEAVRKGLLLKRLEIRTEIQNVPKLQSRLKKSKQTKLHRLSENLKSKPSIASLLALVRVSSAITITIQLESSHAHLTSFKLR